MNIILACTGNQYPGLHDAVASYKARAECPLFVIADRGVVKGASGSYSDYLVHPSAERLLKSERSYTARWFVIMEFIRKTGLSGPIYCPDWDMLCFRNMVVACMPFLDCEIGACRDMGDHWGGISFFNSTSSLERYCGFIDRLVCNAKCDDDVAVLNDMNTGMWYFKETGVARGDMSEIVNGSTFDGNIHRRTEQFESEDGPTGPTKRIVWKGGVPHFIEASTSSAVAANVVHCWGSYKNRTHELIVKAGIV